MYKTGCYGGNVVSINLQYNYIVHATCNLNVFSVCLNLSLIYILVQFVFKVTGAVSVIYQRICNYINLLLITNDKVKFKTNTN